MRNLVDRVKKGVAVGLLSVLPFLSGCVMSFTRGKEKVDFGMLALPLIGGTAGIKHSIYETYDRENVETAFDSDISINWFNNSSVSVIAVILLAPSPPR